MISYSCLGNDFFIIESVMNKSFVLTAGQNVGDLPTIQPYDVDHESQLWKLQGKKFYNKNGLILEYDQNTLFMTNFSNSTDQTFNIDGSYIIREDDGWVITVDAMSLALTPKSNTSNQFWIVKKVIHSHDGRLIQIFFSCLILSSTDCDFPFVHEGMYVENCVCGTKNEYWCPTSWNLETNSLQRIY